jgi:hypothetical protein
MFYTYVARVCSKCFSCFHSYYVVVNIFHVVSVLSRCYICFTHMLQMYVLNVSSALDLCCIQVFHIGALCFRGIFRELWRHDPGAGGRGAASRGPADGVHSVPRD